MFNVSELDAGVTAERCPKRIFRHDRQIEAMFSVVLSAGSLYHAFTLFLSKM